MSETIVTNIIQPRRVVEGVPPATSFWMNVSREELARAIAARRPYQALATSSDVTYAPNRRIRRED